MKLFADRGGPKSDIAVYHIPGEVLVKVKKGKTESLAAKLYVFGLNIHKTLHLLAGDFVVVQSQNKSIISMLEMLGDLPEVEYAEPNYTNQPSLPNSQSREATTPWEKFVVKEAAIELIDSKIDVNFPEVKPDIKVNRKNVTPLKSGDYMDEITIKDLLFISDKVPVNLAEAVEAIDYATKREVNIVSNSWVRDGFSKALDEAIHVADKKGISFVAAASIAATMGSSMNALGSYNPSSHYFQPSPIERRPASHVSAGVLSLYIAHEGKVEKTGRGRLIAKAALPDDPKVKELAKEIRITQDFSFPGAKFIKLEIETFNADTNLDLIILRNAEGEIIENISGSGLSFETDYIETNIITVEFTSNATSTSVGSVIRNVKVIY